ncbi:MAG TPA: thioredoxin [Clostridia bacterium]|nr:thioredoxin [Clostridia bacterium]
MSYVTEVRDVNDMLGKLNKPAVVDFWAETCGPCIMLGHALNDLAEEYKDEIAFLKVNVDENEEQATTFGVMSLPTLIFFNEGKEVDRTVGIVPKELLKRKLGELAGQ